MLQSQLSIEEHVKLWINASCLSVIAECKMELTQFNPSHHRMKFRDYATRQRPYTTKQVLPNKEGRQLHNQIRAIVLSDFWLDKPKQMNGSTDLSVLRSHCKLPTICPFSSMLQHKSQGHKRLQTEIVGRLSSQFLLCHSIHCFNLIDWAMLELHG